MQHKTHKVAGLCAGIIAATILMPPPYDSKTMLSITVFTMASLIGSVAPDIDEPNSVAGRKIKPLSRLIKSVFGHRMITHTPLFLAGLMFVFYWLGLHYLSGSEYFHLFETSILGFAVGYVSHFIMDSLNPTGIMYLWPLSKKRFSMMKIKTGHNELAVQVVTIIITLAYFYFFKFH